MEPHELAARARQAQQLAYAPYSHFTVGAALLTAEGEIYTGANIENASFGLTVCAERVALFRAIMAGKRQFQAIAITGSGAGYIYPCGACLQVMAEFSGNIKIYSVNEKDEIKEYYINEMLPQVFAFKEAGSSADIPAVGDSFDKHSGISQDDPCRRDK